MTMDHTGLQELSRLRLEALVAQLSRELLLAEGYPDVQARLTARRIRAQMALEELSHSTLPRSPYTVTD